MYASKPGYVKIVLKIVIYREKSHLYVCIKVVYLYTQHARISL